MMRVFFNPLNKVRKKKIQKLLNKGKKHFERKEYVSAYNCFSQGASLKSPEAQYYLALCYLNGHGVAFSLQEASLWFESAASAGYNDAEYMLALLYMRGLPELNAVTGHDIFTLKQAKVSDDLKTDYEKARYWAQKVAENGSADGQALYAYLLSEITSEQNQFDEIIKWYDKSISQGSPQGYMGKGLFLLKISKTQDDFSKAAALLQVAAENGLGTAIYTLAIMYETGKGVEINHEYAVQLYKQAAELGIRQAQALYGIALRKGNGVERNFIEAETWLRRAAVGGDVEAASVLADMLASGNKDIPPNYTEAIKWYQFAFLEKQHVGAAFALGYLYFNGLGVVKAVDKAIDLYKFAADKGYLPALDILAEIALTNSQYISVEEVVDNYLRPQAEKGNKKIMLKLAMALTNNKNSEVDLNKEKEAKKWLQICCDEDAEAQYWYGRMLLQGIAGEKNLKEACKWIKSSAKYGIVKAQLLWASLLSEGKTEDGKIHIQEALEFFKKAAEKSDASGMFSLGAIYGGGNHLRENRQEAQKWFEKAAELGHSKAQLMLGRYLYDGLAGNKDIAKARYWFEKAKDNGEKEAGLVLNALDEEINQQDLKPVKNKQVEVAPGLFIFQDT